MVRGKMNSPLSRSLQRLHTWALVRLPVPLAPSFSATAWVQFAGVTTVPTASAVSVGGVWAASAVSKNGCGVDQRPTFAAQPPPPSPVTPPQYCNTNWRRPA